MLIVEHNKMYHKMNPSPEACSNSVRQNGAIQFKTAS